ncbi:hypothetical protein BH11ARM2_BH11ARM2_01140 [soil metagenome]
MRAYLLGALLLLASAAGAVETKYNLFQKDQKIGTLTHNSEGSDMDGYTDTTVMELSQDGHDVKLTEVSKYDKDGITNESSLNVHFEGGDGSVVATLSDGGAKIKSVAPDGAEEGSDVPLATDTSRKDPTWFWFKTVKPEVGTKATYQDYDIQSGAWEDVTYEVKGRTKVTIGDKEYEGNELERTSGTGEDAETAKIVVDDHGELLLYESDEQRIERVFE